MASKAQKKRVAKKAARAAKKHTGAVVAILLILVVIVAVGAFLYFKVDAVHDSVDELIRKFTASSDESKDLSGGSSDAHTTPSTPAASDALANLPDASTYGAGDLSFHFLELGNNYTGDSIYIKAGEIDILIDAGSRQNSAAAISSYVDTLCTDGKLEYVIATHAHQDHIAGFTNTTKNPGIFARYECGIIIDFARTDATSDTYNNYVTARDAEVAAGAKHYTALECWNNANGAQRTYVLGENMSMSILYQRFYVDDASKTEGKENNYSVCVLFDYGEHHYLFTGDLEADGEASLVASNTLPEVDLFKAGHHGSYTASSDALLSVVKPKMVCVCCCAGSIEYTKQPNNHTFPAQEFIDRVAPYTTAVYVTTVGTVTYNEEKGKYEDTGFASMNGTIVVKASGEEATVYCSASTVPLKETAWFKANRTTPAAWASVPSSG